MTLNLWAAACLLGAVIVACGNSPTSDGTTTSQDGITTTVALASASSGSADTLIGMPVKADVLTTANGFLLARANRDLARAREHLSKDVQLEWGPGTTYSTLAAGWAWEDVFGVTAEPIACESSDREDGVDSVLCQLTVQTSINAALGGEPGVDCVELVIEEGLITRASLGVPGPGCDFDYWSTSFGPFERWLADAHADVSLSAMYDDRLSTEGLELWETLIGEFLAEVSG